MEVVLDSSYSEKKYLFCMIEWWNFVFNGHLVIPEGVGSLVLSPFTSLALLSVKAILPGGIHGTDSNQLVIGIIYCAINKIDIRRE